MQKIIFILAVALFLGCNEESIEKTKELNRNNKMLKVNKLNSKTNIASNIESKDEKLLKLNNKKSIELEKIKNKKSLELEKIKNKNKTELAQIEAKKEQRLKEISLKMTQEKLKTDLQKKKLELNKTLAVTKIENNTKIKIKEEENSFYKVAVIILSLVFIIWIIVKYLSTLSKKRHELELKEKEQAHEAYLQELKLKHESINKMLDIISDEKSDKEVKKSLTKLLEGGKNNFIEYKK